MSRTTRSLSTRAMPTIFSSITLRPRVQRSGEQPVFEMMESIAAWHADRKLECAADL